MKCHPTSFYSDIKYHMTLGIIFNVAIYRHSTLFQLRPTIVRKYSNYGFTMLAI